MILFDCTIVFAPKMFDIIIFWRWTFSIENKSNQILGLNIDTYVKNNTVEEDGLIDVGVNINWINEKQKNMKTIVVRVVVH